MRSLSDQVTIESCPTYGMMGHSVDLDGVIPLAAHGTLSFSEMF